MSQHPTLTKAQDLGHGVVRTTRREILGASVAFSRCLQPHERINQGIVRVCRRIHPNASSPDVAPATDSPTGERFLSQRVSNSHMGRQYSTHHTHQSFSPSTPCTVVTMGVLLERGNLRIAVTVTTYQFAQSCRMFGTPLRPLSTRK